MLAIVFGLYGITQQTLSFTMRRPGKGRTLRPREEYFCQAADAQAVGLGAVLLGAGLILLAIYLRNDSRAAGLGGLALAALGLLMALIGPLVV